MRSATTSGWPTASATVGAEEGRGEEMSNGGGYKEEVDLSVEQEEEGGGDEVRTEAAAVALSSSSLTVDCHDTAGCDASAVDHRCDVSGTVDCHDTAGCDASAVDHRCDVSGAVSLPDPNGLAPERHELGQREVEGRAPETEVDEQVEEEGAGVEETLAACDEEYGVCALDQLNDSLEGGSEAMLAVGAGGVDDQSVARNEALPFAKLSKHSTRECISSARRRHRVLPRSAGSLLTARLQLSGSRVPLADITGSRVPGRYTERELYQAGVHPTTVRLTAQNAADFQFSGEVFFSSAGPGRCPCLCGRWCDTEGEGGTCGCQGALGGVRYITRC